MLSLSHITGTPLYPPSTPVFPVPPVKPTVPIFKFTNLAVASKSSLYKRDSVPNAIFLREDPAATSATIG